MKKNNYLIGKAIVFYPEQSRLVNLLKGSASLNAPASQCLLLLIENKHRVIPQHEFFKEVWEDRGTYVTANTFYQNISILRRCLKEVGLKEELVITVPKIGLTLSKTISVQDYSEDIFDDNNQVDNNNAADKETALPNQEKSSPNRMFIFLWLLIIVPFIIFSILSSWVYNEYADDIESFSEYAYLNKIDGCTFYSPKDNLHKMKYIEFINEYKLTCPAGYLSYITIPRIRPFTTVITCDKELFKNDVSCESHFYMKVTDAH